MHPFLRGASFYSCLLARELPGVPEAISAVVEGRDSKATRPFLTRLSVMHSVGSYHDLG